MSPCRLRSRSSCWGRSGRYGVHDLLRAYAAERARREDRADNRAAAERTSRVLAAPDSGGES
ncbi:MAG: hypothetical protein ACJ73S_16275 [Mycobacteriales bacterium]